jgi:hypothetical protein
VNAEVCTMEEVAAVMKQCSGFVVGSPTLGGNMPTPVKVYILRVRFQPQHMVQLSSGLQTVCLLVPSCRAHSIDIHLLIAPEVLDRCFCSICSFMQANGHTLDSL